MKRVVVSREDGNIIATAPYFTGTSDRPNDGGPNIQEIVPFAGQSVHVVEFPDEAARSVDSLLAFHSTHRIRVKNGRAELESI
jgi:hypothetical protein